MAAKHGTRRRYVEGCRCAPCTEANSEWARDYRARRAADTGALFKERKVAEIEPVVTLAQPRTPSPVESGVLAELSGTVVQARPGLAAAALAMARLLDNPRAVSQQPAAAKVLAALLEKLHSASGGRRGNLALVRTMTEKGGA